VPGKRAETAAQGRERGTAPASLHAIATFVNAHITIDTALDRLTAHRLRHDSRVITSKEACAALVTAQALGWIDWAH
jgi:hypothetical protein